VSGQVYFQGDDFENTRLLNTKAFSPKSNCCVFRF